MKKQLNSTLLFVLILVFSSCSYTTGQGPVAEKGFAKDLFQGVELEGSFNVNITQGARQNVVVRGQENIIEKLKMDVLEGVLYISLEPGSYMNYDLDVDLTMPTVKSVVLSGSGDIHLGTFVGLSDFEARLNGSGDINTDGVLEVSETASIELDGSGDINLSLKAQNVLVELDGSGDINLNGTTSVLKAVLDGSGDIKTYKLEALRAEVELDGAGDIKVYASKSLKATLDGAGDIRYKGKPTVEAKIDGAGTIEAN